MRAARWTHPTTQGSKSSLAVRQSLESFYAYEAELLDEWNLLDWLELVAADFVYRIPVPLVTDEHNQLGYDPCALFMDETRESIAENWIPRLTDEHNAVSWADRPPVRTRRFVSGVRVRATDRDQPGDYLARMNVLVSMVRQDTQRGELIGERFDVVRQVGDSFVLISRFVVLLQSVIDAPRLRTIV